MAWPVRRTRSPADPHRIAVCIVPGMNAANLPIPPLIAALLQVTPQHGMDAAAVAEALGSVAQRLGLAGIRLRTLEAGPLPPLTVGWGSLAGEEGGGVQAAIPGPGDAAVATIWTDGPSGARPTAVAAIGSAVQSAGAHVRADRAEQHLAGLDAAVRGIAGVLSADRVLQLIVDRVRILADAQYAALGIVGDDGLITSFHTSGIDADTRERIGPLPRGQGLLGLIIRENTSFRIPDLHRDARRYGFPPNHPEMHSFLGVPVTVRGRSVGNLYLTNKLGRAEFSTDDQALVERFALHAGIAIDNARLHEQVQRLAVVEERERIGRDLHDGIIQRIYGVNLSLDDVPELVRDDPDEASRRVDQAIDSLNEAIGAIREFIYVLRPPGTAIGELTASLQALASEVRLQSSIPVEVHAEDVPRVPGPIAAELLHIAREALSNVARHAGAGRADVSLELQDGDLVMAVSDDGSGFDTAAEPEAGHQGLVNIRQRASRLGGTLRVISAPGMGTRVIITVPHGPATEGRGTGI
jgi:signal transduction histidine kinase